jgi:PAS domain S-box-containing protein
MEQRPDLAALRLAAIVESSDDAIVSKDINGIVMSWNTAAERIFGYTAEEMIGRSITRIIPRDRLSEEEDVLRRIRRNERVDHFETIRQRKDGALINISLTVSPIRDDAGIIVGASKVARDVTERKRAEQALADLQLRLKTLLSASSRILRSPTIDDVQSTAIDTAQQLLAADAYALWRLDPSRGAWRVESSHGLSTEFANRVVMEGLQSEQWDERFTSAVVIEDVASDPMLEANRDAYLAEGVVSMMMVALSVRGRRVGTLVLYNRRPHAFTPVEIQTAEALAHLITAALTTAHLYEAAEHGKEQATFLARAADLLGSSLDYEKTLAAVANLAVPYVADWCAIDMLGDGGRLKRLAVAHADPSKVAMATQMHERYPDDASSPVHDVLRSGQPLLMKTVPPEAIAKVARDEEHLRLLNNLSIASLMCVPLTARGRTFGAFTLVSAESGRHFTEDDLGVARDLSTRAAMAIDNAHAYRQATEANRLKDDFLATLSHELRTPLNAVMGYTKMLAMNVLDEAKQANAVKVIERNASSLKQIIDDVLDVSRIVSGKLRLNVQPLNLSEVVRMSIATVVPAADAKGVELETHLDADPPLISGDTDRLQQIVWNLVSNAMKFTPQGGRITVTVASTASHVEIVVTDTGRGISRDFLPHIFERFRQADGAFSREYGGLGLGLAIVRELVELHGGTVHATSDGPGKGSTFRVELPVLTSHAGRTPAPADKDDALAVPPGIRSAQRVDGVKVLAVDDERDARGLLREILEAAGAEVWTAGSAKQALTVLTHFVPDVIIADIGMPDVDGLEFIRRVRRELTGAARDVPAAALTAYARAQDRITALASGFQMHITKPVDPAELVVAVSALAQGTEAATR